MSLENKIDQLTKAVESLTAQMLAMQATAPTVSVEAAPIQAPSEPTTEQVAVPQANAVTKESVQAFVITKVRANPDNKATVKGLLAAMGERAISSISDPAKLAALFEKLQEELK